MNRKLQCIVVDDDPLIHAIFKDYLKDNEYAEVTNFYDDPVEFINSNKKPDLVFLDIVMPHIDGFTVARKIKPTPVVLFTGISEHFQEIMNMIYAIDAFPKPILKERLLESIRKAYTLLNINKVSKERALFNTTNGQVSIVLKDILFVKTIKNSHRNLELYLKDGRKMILKGYSLELINNIAGFLLQSNRFELVSPDAVDFIEPNCLVKLKCIREDGMVLYTELHRSFRKCFLSHFPSI
jgi:DNA-binding LytR/AlgR family response regulator